MSNVLNTIGESITVNVKSEIDGIVTLTNFTEDITGEEGNRTLKREFRVSDDNVFWTDWKTLNVDNLIIATYYPESVLYIQAQYTRTGVDTSGSITFNSIQFYATRISSAREVPTVLSSMFASLWGSKTLNDLEINLFKKLYYRGIIPDYIKRNDNFSKTEDADYINVFYSIARFFSMIVCFFKRFEDFSNDTELMKEQVRQYGMYFDESNVTLEELQYLLSTLYDQIRQRGTEMIFLPKDYITASGNVVPIDGEYLRLMRIKENDELNYELTPLNKVGWCLNNSSPLYCGTSQATELNKTHENTQDFVDLNNFAVSSSGSSSVSLVTDGDKQVLSIKSSGGTAGLGRLANEQAGDYMYNIDSQLDYEITFMMKIVSGTPQLTFGAEGFDIKKGDMDDAFVSADGDFIYGSFIDNLPLTNFKQNVWYQVRGIIRAYSSVNIDNDKTNLGIGTNLKFQNSFTQYILPKIQCVSSSSSELRIWDYKIRPLVRGKNIVPLKGASTYNAHSLGFIQCSKIFYCYSRNNNNSQSIDEIEEIVEKYLLPFNFTNMFVFTGNY